MPEITTIILTGGAATRMQPLSLDKSKCMISFMGKPLLFYLIKALKSYQFSDLVFTSSGRKGEVKEYFGGGGKFGVNIRYSNIVNWRGTAGTIKDLIDEMQDTVSNTFMVIYGDSLLKVNYEKMLEFHRAKKSWCTILYHHPNFESFLYDYHDKSFPKRGDRTNFGVMNIKSDNRITKVKEKPTIKEIKRKFTNPVANAVVHILEREVLDFIPSNCKFDFPKDLFPILIKQDVACFGFDVEKGYRIDIGTIANYYSFQFSALEGKIDFDFHYHALKEGIWVGKRSIIRCIDKLNKPVLICANSRIDSDADIECSIIGNNVYIGNSSSIKNSIVLDNVHIGNRVRLSHSIIGENVFIGDGTDLPPNTVLGNHCRLGGAELLMNDSDLYGLIGR